MIDFEIFKVSGPYTAKDKEQYRTQINEKWYDVPRGMRNLNRLKLQAAYDKGLITPVKETLKLTK